MNSSTCLVTSVRFCVEKQILGEKFHPQDVDAFRKFDSYVARFLEENDQSVQKAALAIVSSFRFRLSRSLAGIRDEDVAREMIECGQMTTGMDTDGQLFLLDKCGLHRRIRGLNDLLVRLNVWEIDELHRAYGYEAKVDLYLDLEGAGPSSTDLDLARRLFKLHSVCFPNLVRRVFIFGLPTAISLTVTAIMRMLPKTHSDKVMFVTADEARRQMGPLVATAAPPHCSTLAEVCSEQGLSSKEIYKLEAYFAAIEEKHGIRTPLSLFEGSKSKVLTRATLFEALKNQVSQRSHEVAVISDHENICKTFIELFADVVRTANGLVDNLELGLGDQIAIWSTNCYAYIVLEYATAAVGLTLWLFDPSWTARELGHGLELSEAKVLFMPGVDSPQNFKLNYVSTFNEVASSSCPKSLRTLVMVDGETADGDIEFDSSNILAFDEVSADCSEAVLTFDSDSVTCDATYLVIFTSGSTGAPKAVQLSQYAVLNNNVLMHGRFDYSSGRRYCLPLPLYHSFGSLALVTGIAALGLQLVLTGHKYSVSGIVDCMVRHRCTHLAAVPTMILDVVSYVQKANVQLPSWVGLFTAGAPAPMDAMRALTQLVPTMNRTTVAYGASELGPAASCSNVEDGNHFDHAGSILDHVTVKIVDVETKETVPMGTSGLVLVKTPFRMNGYAKNAAKTAEVFDTKGWYDTGDIAKMDTFGRLFIIGRFKEVISRGGEKIHPIEIEEALYLNSSVLTASAFAVPDKRLGQQACAWVQVTKDSKLDGSDLKKFLSGKLSAYKIPHYVLVTCEDVPLTGSGKVAKTILRERALETLELSAEVSV